MPAGIGGRESSLWRRCSQNLQDGAGEVLNACVDYHPIVQIRIERNMIFQVNLEVGQSVRLKFWRSGGR